MKALNIVAFVKLGEGECEKCLRYENHQHDNSEKDCNICEEAKIHEEEDRITCTYQLIQKLFSVDMEKVRLPRMPGRVVAYHETSAPLGKKQKEKPYSIIWHETISGRNAENAIITFIRLIRCFRDGREFTL